jgi:predicted pyridoxine 5'-phosphate oxidase superfamily flavin-nucleotide-binding protein
MASRVGKSMHSTIPLVAQDFLRQQPLAVFSTVDTRGGVWASLLTGPPGFMQAVDDRTVRITATPVPGDPLRHNLQDNAPVGMVVIEFPTRQRLRLNGTAAVRPDGSFDVQVRQVYANCPKYIQTRQWTTDSHAPDTTPRLQRTGTLTAVHQAWIAQADTFFVASFHPEGGADVSHRGGAPGFIRVVQPSVVVWPDYAGNTMFQTLGNIVAYPQAGVLFIDFTRSSTLQLTGRAEVIWDADRVRAFAGAERLVKLHVEQVLEMAGASPLRWQFGAYSPFHPA